MMKKQVVKMVGLVVSAIALVVLSGCSCPQYAASEHTANAVETASSKNVDILWADSHRLEDKLIVHGAVKRSSHSSVPMKAHVDVTVLSADGEVIQKVQGADIDLPRHLPGKGINIKRFEIELDAVNTEQTTIVVTAHQAVHSG